MSNLFQLMKKKCKWIPFLNHYILISHMAHIYKMFATLNTNHAKHELHAYQHVIPADLIIVVSCQHHIITTEPSNNVDMLAATRQTSCARH